MNKSDTAVYLASQSPRRAQLLEQIAVPFQRIPAAMDETPLPQERPEPYVCRVAAGKALLGWQHVEAAGLEPRPVLAADTAVILGDRIMGKPRDREHGLAMLAALSGQTHQVMTAVCCCLQGRQWSALNITEVSFRVISGAEREQYWLSGEPLGKAGAYAIQGRGAVFVAQLKGSYSGVVGLPLLETSQLLQAIENDTTL